MTKMDPEITLTAEAALAIVRNEPLRCVNVPHAITFEGDVHYPVHFEDCTIQSISAPSADFKKPVILKNCDLGSACFISTHFVKGLIIDNCTFHQEVDFEAGGHNDPGYKIHIVNSRFHGFVNFFDCLYKEALIVENNEFTKGSNLLGNVGQFGIVMFDFPPRINGNRGDLNMDGWGDKPTSNIYFDNK